MQIVYSDKILDDNSGRPGYMFYVVEHKLRQVKSPVEYVKSVESNGFCPSAIEPNTKPWFEFFVQRFTKLGYFSEKSNSFEVPHTSPYKLCISLRDLVYDELLTAKERISRPRIAPSMRRAMIAALNQGIVSRVYFAPGDKIYLELFLEQSHVCLTRLAKALHDNWSNSLEATTNCTIEVEVHPHIRIEENTKNELN